MMVTRTLTWTDRYDYHTKKGDINMARQIQTVAGFKRLMKRYMPEEVVTEDELGPQVPEGVVEAKIGIDTDGVPYIITPEP